MFSESAACSIPKTKTVAHRTPKLAEICRPDILQPTR